MHLKINEMPYILPPVFWYACLSSKNICIDDMSFRLYDKCFNPLDLFPLLPNIMKDLIDMSSNRVNIFPLTQVTGARAWHRATNSGINPILSLKGK